MDPIWLLSFNKLRHWAVFIRCCRAVSCLFGMVKSIFQNWPFCQRGYWVCIIAAALSWKRLVGMNAICGRTNALGTNVAVRCSPLVGETIGRLDVIIVGLLEGWGSSYVSLPCWGLEECFSLFTASDELIWGKLFSDFLDELFLDKLFLDELFSDELFLDKPFLTKANTMMVPNVARVSWHCDSMKAV
jgi:hypothetical protein